MELWSDYAGAVGRNLRLDGRDSGVAVAMAVVEAIAVLGKVERLG